jgi:hypothetical protein
MSARTIYFFLGLGILLVVFYLSLPAAKPAPAEAPTAAETERETVTARNETAAAVVPPRKPSTRKTIASKPPPSEEERPEDVVPFVVEDGVAIAFGDLILGVPEEEGLKTGYTQLGPANAWEKPEIPYAINADLPEPDRIEKALVHIEKKTGIHFYPYSGRSEA